MEIEELNIKNIDAELKLLKEKKHKLKELSSQLEGIKEKQLDEQKKSKKDTSKQEYINNEKLALTKQEILDFCDRVLTKWKKDPSKDNRHIFAMNAVKTSILWTEEDTIKEIWHEIIYWIFELLYQNAIKQGNSENLEWSKIMEKLRHEY